MLETVFLLTLDMLFKSALYKIETQLTEEVVYKILSENTDKKHIRLFSKSNFEFEGIVYKDHFKFEKVITGRNSFNPMIIGKFHKNVNGKTEIEFNLKINSFVSIFFYFWMATVAILGISSIFFIKEWYIAVGVLIAMPLIGCTIYYMGFNMAKENILTAFKRLFNEQIKEIKL